MEYNMLFKDYRNDMFKDIIEYNRKVEENKKINKDKKGDKENENERSIFKK